MVAKNAKRSINPWRSWAHLNEPRGLRVKYSRLHNHMENRRATIKKLTIRELLKPHVTALTIGFLAVVGEGVANLLEPWPLKIVLDSVLRSRPTTRLAQPVHSIDCGRRQAGHLEVCLRRGAGDCGARCGQFLHGKILHDQRRTMGDPRSAPDALLPHPAALAWLTTTRSAVAI